MAKISIIIPVYNSELYIEECLNSVMKQTLRDIEIILINDGSSDSSLEKCEFFRKKDKRVKVFSILNSGAAAARNVGLKNATGEYIGFVDSDDWVKEEMFETLYDVACKNNADIVSCNFTRFYSNKEAKNIISGYRNGFYSRNELIHDFFPYMFGNNNLVNSAPVNMVTKVFRRELIESNYIRFDERLLGGQDIAFSNSAIIHSNSMYLLNNSYFYYYRHNPRSRTNTYMPNAWETSKAYRDYFKRFLSDFTEYDFSQQLSYHKLSGALTAINYETKPGNDKTFRQKSQTIRRICNELRDDETFDLVNYTNLDLKRKISFFLLKKRFSFGFLTFGILRNALYNLMYRE